MRYLFSFILLVALLSGCATVQTVLPNTVGPEVEHMSHATQHQPFTDHPTHYGANMLNLTANWDLGAQGYMTLGEGIDIDHHFSGSQSCGEIVGPREEFSLRLGYRFKVK